MGVERYTHTHTPPCTPRSRKKKLNKQKTPPRKPFKRSCKMAHTNTGGRLKHLGLQELSFAIPYILIH